MGTCDRHARGSGRFKMNTLIRHHVATLSAYTPGEQPTDSSVIKLNTNENPYPPAPGVAAVLQSAACDQVRLYPDPVCLRLRESIARLHGCGIDQVFCGNGSDEILTLCIRAFVPDGGCVGYFEPSYSLYPVLAQASGVDAVPVPLHPDFSWPEIVRDYHASLFFWTNPNAPTSLRCPPEPIRAYAERSTGVLVVDEAYVDFADTDCSELALAQPNVLVTRSFSKSYSLAGIRLGYALGDAELIDALHKIKDAYNVNRLTQEMGRAAVEDQAHKEKNTGRIIATRERVAETLRERGVEVFPSQTNFLWIKPSAVPAPHLFARLREGKILVRHFNTPATRDYLRITIGTDEQMDAFLHAT